MKFIFLIGGCIGFVAVGGASLLAGHEAGRALFDAAVGCLAGASLFRWFWVVLVRGMREALLTPKPDVAVGEARPAVAAAAGSAAKAKK